MSLGLRRIHRATRDPRSPLRGAGHRRAAARGSRTWHATTRRPGGSISNTSISTATCTGTPPRAIPPRKPRCLSSKQNSTTPPRPSRQRAPVVLSSTLPATPVRRTRRPFVLAFVAGGAAIAVALLAVVWSPWRSHPAVKEPSAAASEHRARAPPKRRMSRLPDNRHQRTDAARAEDDGRSG